MSTKEKTLNELHIGEVAVVQKLLCESTAKRRLLDLGVTVGTQVCVLFTSPYKNPVAYEIRGAVIALRLEDSKSIQVKMINN